jgi:sulfite exporter TauE/SafE
MVLPCGMVYVALFYAIAMQSPVLGVFYMMLFGLGTVPMMTAVVYAIVYKSSLRNKIQKSSLCSSFDRIVVHIKRFRLGSYVSPANTSLCKLP